MHVDPIKPQLIAPGTRRLKLKYDKPHLNFAFNFNLRRYTLDLRHTRRFLLEHCIMLDNDLARYADDDDDSEVGRCRLTLSNPS